MSLTGTWIKLHVAEVVQTRRAAAHRQSLRARSKLGPHANRLFEGIEALRSARLGLAKSQIEGDLRRTTDRDERAYANYGLGLIALSERDDPAMLRIGSELAEAGEVGRDYLSFLIAQSDMPPKVRSQCEAALEANEPGAHL